jgi:hypothetical protein
VTLALSLGVKHRKWFTTSHRLACTGHGGTTHQPGLSASGYRWLVHLPRSRLVAFSAGCVQPDVRFGGGPAFIADRPLPLGVGYLCSRQLLPAERGDQCAGGQVSILDPGRVALVVDG